MQLLKQRWFSPHSGFRAEKNESLHLRKTSHGFMHYYAKIISVFLLATVKFFYAPLYAYLIELEPLESAVTLVSGGIASFLFFYYISYFIIISTKIVRPVASRIAPGPLKDKYSQWMEKRLYNRHNKKKFTRRNRMLVRIRRYGMWAVIFTMPILISIPVGAFILRRYYDRRHGMVWLTMFVIALEGAILCWLVWNVPSIRP
jgi:hypothetical protein